MKLSEIVVRAAHASLARQRPDGSFAPGRNGPYGDPETPVRNTAHWLVTLNAAWRTSGEARFREAALRAGRALALPAHRPGGGAFFCRTNPAKDASNGVIGQAWAIEALAEAADALGEPGWRALAERVFLLHPFDAERGLWGRLGLDGTPGPVDRTFNHQLWLAAAAARLDAAPGGEIGARVRRFLDLAIAREHFRVARSGRIAHKIEPAKEARSAPIRAAAVRQEVGYHAYVLYGLALLRRPFPTHPIWSSDVLRQALRYARGIGFRRALDRSEYGDPYNPVGFEMALAIEAFPAARGAAARDGAGWIRRQLRRTDPADPFRRDRAAADPETAAARVYEATRIRSDPDVDEAETTGGTE